MGQKNTTDDGNPGQTNPASVANTAEHIRRLRSLGLQITDEDAAARLLMDVSCHRLEGYLPWLVARATLEKLKELYRFDYDLRRFLFDKGERLEISFRSRLVCFFSRKHGAGGYLDSGSLDTANPDSVDAIAEIKKELDDNSKNPGIAKYKNDYVEGYPPFDEAAEFLSFGKLVRFHRTMDPNEKREFCDEYYHGVDSGRFDTWLNSILDVRNMCAHHERIYGTEMRHKPAIHNSSFRRWKRKIPRDRIFGTLMCMKRMLGDEYGKEFFDALKTLVSGYPGIDLSPMDFPADWKKVMAKEIVF